MIARTDSVGTSPIAYPLVSALPLGVVGLVYLAGYALLYWLSFAGPETPFGISPWNLSAGLGFVLVLLRGRRAMPLLFVGPLLTGFLQMPPALPLTVVSLSAVLTGGFYSVALTILLRPALRFEPSLSSVRDLMQLGLAAAVSAAAVAVTVVAVMLAANLLPPAEFAAAAIRYWVGEMIGIMVIAPFGLIALTNRRALRLSLEGVLQLTAIVAALTLVFGYAEEREFQLFYVLFLPIIWMAVRTGSEGATIGILVTQVGLILGIGAFRDEGHDVSTYQALMLVLATTGLVAGVLVTEHRRTVLQLRHHQESLSHLARLGSMGELAAAVAHELNQPLMAAGTYTRLVNDAISSPGIDAASVAETAKKAVMQVERAAEVVRRLRALVRLDRSSRASYSLQQIVSETLALCQPDLDRMDTDVRVALAADLPPVAVDILQVEQVLLNLLRNSIHAIGETKRPGSISIEAAAEGDLVEVTVRDSGPGFPPSLLDNPFLPFSTTKPEGLGFGLPLCKSIVEAHGGSLWLDSNTQGAAVHFTLPAAKIR
jgi:C4-dicarboxylate-specific signal transduction histidine kinase